MRLPLLLPSALLSACAAGSGPAALSCLSGTEPARTAELLFGRNIPAGGSVDDAEWAGFVAEELAPRFPGFTVSDALGQWTGAAGVEHERSKLVLLVLPGDADDHARLEAVRQAYKARFGQESVLLISRAACIAF